MVNEAFVDTLDTPAVILRSIHTNTTTNAGENSSTERIIWGIAGMISGTEGSFQTIRGPCWSAGAGRFRRSSGAS